MAITRMRLNRSSLTTRGIHHLHRAVVLLLLAGCCAASVTTAVAIVHDLTLGTGLARGRGLVAHAMAATGATVTRVLTEQRNACLGVLAAIAIVSAILLWIELLSMLRSKPRLVLSRGSMGEVAISMEQVGLLAQHEAEHVEGVREVQTIAGSSKQGLLVQQTIAVEPDRQLPKLAEEVQQRVKQSLEYHLGYPVNSVRVALQRASISKALL
jgi:uncharacterized alkaline shock family protein YloU